MWWTLLASFLGKLPGAIGDYFNRKADIEEANLKYQTALVQAQQAMAAEAARAQLEYQTAALQSTTPLFKQRLFWFLSVPILLSVLLPSKAAEMWHNLSLIPDNYWALYSAVVCTIWGLPVAGNMLSKVFNGFTSYAAEKRADKIQMLSVSSEQYKKAFADSLRHVQGAISEKQWDSISKALDQMGEPPVRIK